MAKAPAKKKPEPSEAGFITTAQASRLLMISGERIAQLIKAGYIVREDRNKYNLVTVVQGYINFLKDEERRSTKSAAASRVTDARTREIELRMAEKTRALIPLSEAQDALDFVVGKVRSEMNGLGAKCSRDKDMKRKIDEQVTKSFERVSKTIDKAAGTLEEGGDVLDAVSAGSA